jgi:hypothetical protein
MKSENKHPSKVTLDDLFALKRAEQPPEEFWDDFQRDFHVRQRAEAIEPKRWWFVMPRVFAGLSRHQMPLGAAAVLAVTFLSFREYREPGLEVAYSAPQALPAVVETTTPTPAAPVAVADVNLPNSMDFSEVAPLGVVEEQIEAAVASSDSSQPVELSPMVVWAGPSAATIEAVASAPTPSQQSIAANLATAEAEQLQVGRLLGEPDINLAAAITNSDSLAQVSVPQPTREHLFVYQPSPADFSVDREKGSRRDTHSLIADRISHHELYESPSRLSAGGNHLTVKF